MNRMYGAEFARLAFILSMVGSLFISSRSNRDLVLEDVIQLADDPDGNGNDFNYHFTIKDLQGTKLSFEQLKGKVIFLNLWATWCKPCRDEMKQIQTLYDQSKSDKVEFVMLSIDEDADKEKIEAYIGKNKFTFPVYQPSGRLPEELKVSSIPRTWIIGANGKVMRYITRAINLNKKGIQEFSEYLGILSQQVN